MHETPDVEKAFVSIINSMKAESEERDKCISVINETLDRIRSRPACVEKDPSMPMDEDGSVVPVLGNLINGMRKANSNLRDIVNRLNELI